MFLDYKRRSSDVNFNCRGPLQRALIYEYRGPKCLEGDYYKCAQIAPLCHLKILCAEASSVCVYRFEMTWACIPGIFMYIPTLGASEMSANPLSIYKDFGIMKFLRNISV